MTTYKAKGILQIVGELRTTDSGFTSRRFVVNTSENPAYEKPTEFQFKKERCGDIEGYQPGEAVEVEFTVDGRRWDGPNGTKYFVDLTAWHINRLGVAAAPTTLAAPAQPAATGANMQTAVETWKKHHGDDKAGFAEYCRSHKPGKKSSEYTSNDWGDIIKALEADAANAAKGDDFDDMPF